MYGPHIEGARVALAPPLPSYVDDYLRWFSDPAVTRYLNLRNPPAREQEEEFLRRMAAADTEVFWAILVGERHIGSTGVHGLDWRNRTAHTGIVIGERDCWGQGYATEAIRLRTAYAFNELGLETLTTQVYAPNEASRRALQRAGYREVGWLRRHVYFEGEFHDVWLGEMLRGEA
jgi:[ribosomal protein S5]-alanine N-acetyltransferase